MDMPVEQDHPINHRLGEENMNMVGSHMVEVTGMDTVEEHYHLMNHRPEVEGMDTVEEQYHLMNHRPDVDGMDRKDMTVEVEVVEREPEGVVLVRHWTGGGVARHR
jgi:hypothetical protein